ncbi:hypothetical protein C1645_837542 [Glomus cerebriforme]|uniref:Uncharacterized protein n=1 Tax=Glomus cerebriforme TaxID=658196 RepID=A0A397SF84_9GLOM|nr:hypothetical protein C1645_837542 [Glomus cerebriforme]
MSDILVKINVDKIEYNMDEIEFDIDKPHKGKPITKIEVSPNEKYLVTYSQKYCSIVGWNVDKDEGQLKPDYCHIIKNHYFINQLCVSDDKKLAYIYNDRKSLKIIDMKDNNDQEMKLSDSLRKFYCTFNLKILDDVKFVGISNHDKYDKLYLFSNNHIHEWNIQGKTIITIFMNKFEKKDIGISSNKRFICIRFDDKIIIYSIELKIPIATLYIDNGRLRENNQLPREYQTDSLPNLPNNILVKTKYAFGILDGHIWKFKLESKISKIKFSFQYSDELENENNKIIESWNVYLDKYKSLVIKFNKEQKSIQDLIKWNVEVDEEKIKLQIFKKNDGLDLICTKEIDAYFLESSYVLTNNNIVILTTTGLFIYNFNEKLQNQHKKVFSKPTLPLPNYDSFKLNDEWVSYLKNNKEILLKYGVELLSFAIKEHKLELDEIYRKCIIYFKEDLSDNKITS